MSLPVANTRSLSCCVSSQSAPRQQQPRQPAWGNASSSVSAVSQNSQPQAAHQQQQPRPAAAPQRSIEEQKAEFDFESANARFEKVHEPQVPSYDLPAADAPVVAKKYDKSKSFFDELTTDKTASREVNRRAGDQDTFGSDASGFRSKHSRGRGPRRDGQGGGGRGGGGAGQKQGGGEWRQQ